MGGQQCELRGALGLVASTLSFHGGNGVGGWGGGDFTAVVEKWATFDNRIGRALQRRPS